VTATAPQPPTQTAAAEQLAVFFFDAERMDAQLRHAATLINAGFLRDTVRLDSATVAAVLNIQPKPLAHTIPAGLDRHQLRAVLLVYSELVTRRAAMNRIVEYAGQAPLRRDSDEVRDLLRCLSNGTAGAAAFGRDLAAARAVASFAAPTSAGPTSRAAAEVAIQAAYIRLMNNGCGDCGNQVLHELLPLTWKPGTPHRAERFEGMVNRIQFQAQFQPVRGWTVELNAC
jgi:hypothetical protein